MSFSIYVEIIVCKENIDHQLKEVPLPCS